MHCISWLFLFWFVQWVLMPSEKWHDGGVCLRLPIRDIRDVNGFLSEDILYWSLAPWDEDVVILILPWRRRLSPVATRRRLVSAEYFGYLLVKHFILCMCFLKENLKRWLVCFLSARLIHQRKIINYLAVWHQDATWNGGRYRPKHIVLDGDPGRGTVRLCDFRHISTSVWA